ncbi:MAG: prepilin-type N-terminal cleavage/methylation domain-containing protein [Burkholderiales bacterium]|nr:prepilin-type N-terminal cleavage/methylation domain-containing protein [Burkholderiales bacterium]
MLNRTPTQRRRHTGHAQRGLSLVELMVGVAIGLFIVAGATTVVATQLADTRRLTLETQMQQDLRATADIMVRQLRRAGYWSAASSTVWSPGAAWSLNPGNAITLVSPTEVTIALSGSTVTGYYLNPGPPGVLMQKFGPNPSQALTDGTTMSITGFNLQLAPLTAVQPVQMSCPALCPDGTQTCWPTVQPQELLITITGQAVSDPSVVRTLQSAVRLRNDQIVNHNGTGLAGPLCPG